MKKFLLLLLVLSVGFQGALLAQTRTVTGKVTGGDDGQGIPRVNITVKGTTRGVPSGLDGTYTIEVSPSDVLVFSFVGYITKEVPVGNQTTINVTLDPDYAELEEVVVVGYGSQEKKEITSSVVALDAEDFNQGNVNDPTQLLQGKVPGLSIYNKGGNPNGGATIRLRGISTVGANVQPLVVIDGVIGASLDNVDPNDIATVNVLKDGSAAAIYGSRGSAGVILVTTKSGNRGGGLQASYNGYVAADEVFRFQPVMTPDEYVATGGNDLGSRTIWQEEITRTGISHVHNIAVSGGSENTTFRVSTNFRNIQGVLKKSGFDQINARANVNHYALNDRLNIQFNLSMTNRDQNFSFNEAFRYAALFNPTAPIRNPDGSYFQAILFDNFNPVAIIEQNVNLGKRNNLNFNTQMSYDILDNLTWSANYAQQFTTFTGGTFYPSNSLFRGFDRTGLASRRTDESKFTLFETYGTFVKDFDNANLTISAGYSFQEEVFTGFGMEAGNFPSNDLGYNIIGSSGNILGDGANVSLFSYESPENRIIAFFGRVNFSLDNGIFVNASVRREGSTKLGAENRWGTFPAFGVGADLLNYFDIAAFSQLKLRAGYGVTGSLPGPSGLAQDLFSYGFGGGGTVSFVRAGNPDLKWEEKAEINLGLDFGLLGGQLSGSLDVYSRDINDFILERTVDPAVYGTDRRYENAGKLNTKGLEFAINHAGIGSGDLNWSPGVVLSTYSTTLEEFVIPEQMIANLGSPGQNGTNMVRIAVGEKIGQIWGPVFSGNVDAEGRPVFVDLNNDGNLNTDQGNALDDDGDFQQLGNGIPTLEIGWTNQLSYGNWDLNVFFRAAFGHSLVNTFRAFYEPIDLGAINSYNRTKTDLQIPELQVAQFSSLYVEKADFFRLDNATLGYNFDMSNNSMFSKLRMYLSVQNAFVITNYQGIDPDPSLVDINDGNVLAPGIDRRNNYFTSRTFTFGLNVGF
ncbi:MULTISPECIES: SusC/RagA family TonB-linked outer membrane protein [Roseivirga]|jgi:iron complex outermembrane receptor protein|uniref:SusC/RagA family TonB-linked outer membrane protein n=1 Tax=Roseivirga thermotolerans TaxID=1758176 RepID=A0ABQ3I110_9BACT|nr:MULTISPECIES: SusC/RagA family TonB-linked outer membrane protein [Roseivirga]GHE54334.1 SusC/RagA family TonB-linked outer membrane protein [Roseivirga thermotolerans]|tara:strand:- start:32047 stop:34953 length:2907 start_codon:yes stop_codon:yes gene_type:complete